MEPRYRDAEGRIDYEAIERYAGKLRHEAIDAFWSALFAKLAMRFTNLRGNAGGPMSTPAR